MNINFRELYDTISNTLTDYEGYGDEEMKDNPQPLYDLLCDIQNHISERM